jgi:hypothetical protein
VSAVSQGDFHSAFESIDRELQYCERSACSRCRRSGCSAAPLRQVRVAVPFPKYDNSIELHLELAARGKLAEEAAGGVDVSSARTFQPERKLVAAALVDNRPKAKIEAKVAELVPTLR